MGALAKPHNYPGFIGQACRLLYETQLLLTDRTLQLVSVCPLVALIGRTALCSFCIA